MSEGGVPRDEAGVGRARTPNPDELPGDATSEHRGETRVSEYVIALQGGLRAAYRHACARLQRAALQKKHDYDGKVQRQKYQAGELV